jgi:hypothetical protein
MKYLLILFLFFITRNIYSQDSTLLDSVLKQLDLNKSKIKTEFVVSKVIPNNSNETILVIPEIVVEEEDYFEFNSYILIVNTKTGKIIHNYSEKNAWISDAVQLTEIIIDTANYQISEQNRAFGIKVKYSGSSQPNPYKSESFSLFIKSGTTLKKVLINYEILYYGGEWDTNCEGEFLAMKKIIIVSKNKTNDYFDLIVKNKITETKNMLDKNGNCNTLETFTEEKTILKFNGLEYKFFKI